MVVTPRKQTNKLHQVLLERSIKERGDGWDINRIISVSRMRSVYITFLVTRQGKQPIGRHLYRSSANNKQDLKQENRHAVNVICVGSCKCGRGQLKYDGTRAETKFSLSAKRTSPFKSVGASVQSTTGSRGIRISGSNAGYTMFRGSVKSTGYTLHSPVSPSLPLPRVTVCHHISTGVFFSYLTKFGEYLSYLSKCQLLKKDSADCTGVLISPQPDQEGNKLQRPNSRVA